MDMEESSEAMTGMLMELEAKMVLVLKTEVTFTDKVHTLYRIVILSEIFNSDSEIEKVKLLTTYIMSASASLPSTTDMFSASSISSLEISARENVSSDPQPLIRFTFTLLSQIL